MFNKTIGKKHGYCFYHKINPRYVYEEQNDIIIHKTMSIDPLADK